MVTKQFLIRERNGRFITSVLQGEEHLTQDLNTETRTSEYTQFLDRSELILEVSKAVESYIKAFDKSANYANSNDQALKIHLTIN